MIDFCLFNYMAAFHNSAIFLPFSPIFVSIYVHSSSSYVVPPIHSTRLYSNLLISSLLSSSLIKSHLLPSAFLSYLLLSHFSSPLLPSHLFSYASLSSLLLSSLLISSLLSHFSSSSLFFPLLTSHLLSSLSNYSPNPYICTVWGKTPMADVANIGKKLKLTGSPVIGSGKPSHTCPVEQWTLIPNLIKKSRRKNVHQVRYGQE